MTMHAKARRAHPLTTWFVACLLSSCAHGLDQETSEARFLEGLRSRRQFWLVTQFCERELRNTQLPIASRVTLTVELVRSHTEQATHAPASSRLEHWQRAHAVGEEFLAKFGDQRSSILVEVQVALSDLARGELTRVEAELGSDQQRSLEIARQSLRQATRELERLDKRIAQARADDRQSAWSQQDAVSLRHHVQRQLVRALRNLALCYPARSTDRMAALSEGVRQLQKPLTERSAEDSDPLRNELLLEQATCQRLLGELRAALLTLKSMQVAQAPRMLLRQRAARMRISTASQDWNAAGRIIAEGRTAAGEASPDLDFAILEAYVDRWRSSAANANPSETNQWRDRAIKAAEFIEKNHGAYWARRADLALVHAGQQRGSGGVAILSRTADDLYLKGQLEEARAVYDQAAAAAQQAGDANVAFELGFKAALIAQRSSKPAEASQRFQKIALAKVEDPRAPQAHQLAVMNAAEAVRGRRWPLERYEELLSEHIDSWPAAITIGAVALWQGQLKVQQGDWPGAIAAFQLATRDVGGDHQPANEDGDNLVAAVAGLARAWQERLGQLAGDERLTLAGEAIDSFDHLAFVDRAVGRLRTPWSLATSDAAYHAARLRLLYRASELAAAVRLLTESTPAATTADWGNIRQFQRQLLHHLLVAIQAGEGELPGRLATLALVDGSTQAAFDLLREVGQRTQAAAPTDNGDLLRLQWGLAVWLESHSELLATRDKRETKLYRARALIALDRQAGLAAWAILAEQYRGETAVQVEYGRQLIQFGRNRETHERALGQWRRIAGQSPARTTEWFEAKYFVARLLHQLGDSAAAAQRIRYLQVTEDLSESGFADRFETLLEQCNR